MQPANGNALSVGRDLMRALFCLAFSVRALIYGKKNFSPICFFRVFLFPRVFFFIFFIHSFSFTVTILDYNLVWFYLYLFVYNFFPFHDDDGIVRQLLC